MEEANVIEFDFFISLKDEQENSKKWVRIYEEDNLIIGSAKTSNYFKGKNDEKMDLSSDESTQGSKEPLA